MNKNYNGVLALKNVGNTCYFNSALQCLMSLPLEKELVSHQNVIILLGQLFYNKYSSEIPISNPILLKNALGECHNFFKGNYQQDCHECLINIIDVIHNISKDVRNIIPQSLVIIPNSLAASLENVALGNWKKHNHYNGESFFSSIFNGQIRSCLICNICNKERNNFEIINNISLSLGKGKSVDITTCFKNYFSSEILGGGESVNCDYCKIPTPTTKKLSLWRFPKIFIIHLKRYTQNISGNYTRNNCLVDFTPDLSFHVYPKNKKKVINYNLKTVVNHFGYTPHGGHYTSMVKNQHNWLHIDDCNIYKCDESELCTPTAYILIYERES